MKESLEACSREGILPRFDINNPPTLYVYMPSRKMLLKYRERLKKVAIDQFTQIYPGIEPKIRFRVTAATIGDILIFSSTIQKLVDAFGRRYPDDAEAQKYAQAIKRINEESATEAISQKEALIEQDVLEDPETLSAPTVRKLKFGAATVRFLVLAATRTAQTMGAIMGGGPEMAAGLALVVSDSTLEFFTVAFTRKLQAFFAKSPISWGATASRARLARFFNNIFWNLIGLSVGRPLAMQELAHIANGDSIRAPTAGDAASLLGFSSFGAVLYSGFSSGYETLRQKGWLSAAQIDLMLQISGLFDLVTGVFSSNPSWHFYRVFTWGPQWTFFALVAAIAKLAPVRMDKIVAVESSIVNWQDVHEEQLTDQSWHVVTQEDLAAAFEKIRDAEPLRKTVSNIKCEILLTHTAQKTKEVYNRVRKLLSSVFE
jgi:hypothetical protein